MLAAETFKNESRLMDPSHITSEYLQSLEMMISDISSPVFIVSEVDGSILTSNEKAKKGFKGGNPNGKKADQVLYRYERLKDDGLVFFQNRWYKSHLKKFSFLGNRYIKVQLKEQTHLPGNESIEAIQHLISVILHRFRSPLTGMQGFAYIIEQDNISARNKKYIEHIDSGIQHLFEMLDELEQFLDSNTYSETNFVSMPDLVEEILSAYPHEVAQTVKIRQSGSGTIFGNSGKLKKILSLLIENALQHSGNDEPVTVFINTPHSIQITNQCATITNGDKKNMFKPFYTTMADKMGIGLTFAQMIAAQMGATIQSECYPDNNITFSLLFPPKMVSVQGAVS